MHINVGGVWVDKEVLVSTEGSSTLITSRKPDDLPAFCSTLVEEFTKATVESK
jgi:protease I